MTAKKTALIVGAGRGCGLEMAKALAPQCGRLLLSELPERCEALEAEAAAIRAQTGAQVDCFPLDVRSVSQIETRFEAFKDIPLQYVVCNAGINMLVDALEVTEEIWDQISGVNVKGNFFVLQQAARNMILGDGGSMVVIGSQHATVANRQRAPYCASKAGLLHLTKALALEWAAHGIRVNAVSPTYILYPENEALLTGAKGRREYLRRIPLNDYCSARDVAEAVLFLLSDRARMITGHNLIVDGGWSIQ